MRSIAAFLLSVSGLAFAMFATLPEDVPLARLEENVKAYLAKNPGDKNAHYVLGRLYSIAYATNAEVVKDVTPGFAPAGATEGERGTTWCPDGVERSDGGLRPTWDWTPRSVR